VTASARNAAWETGSSGYAVFDQASKRDQNIAMTEYRTIYEQGRDGWWAYVPDLPGCTAFGETRDAAERNAREAIAAHIALLRETGHPVPEPSQTAA